MSHQVFTLQELKRAWRQLKAASNQPERSNAHRLLLVYSIECGLKAVWLKLQCRTLFTTEDINKTGHDINAVIKDLGCSLSLPNSLAMSDVKDLQMNSVSRKNIRISDLHQVWRYGGLLIEPPANDADVEAGLEKIQDWIEKELV